MELEGGRGAEWAVKTLPRPPDMNTCIVVHSGDIHSFIYAISFYIGLIMLISMSAPRNGSMSLFLNGFTAPGFILMVKGHVTMDKVMAPQTSHRQSACVCTLGHFVGIKHCLKALWRLLMQRVHL